MKRIIVLVIVCAVGTSIPGRAQFLKNLTNNIKQTLQSRANGKTNQTTNLLLDKIDSATNFSGAKTGKKSAAATSGGATGVSASGALPGIGASAGMPGPTSGPVDTSGLGRVLGAFAKTARENPNDTSQADLVMKSLSRLTGGDGVSPQDSAAAIRSFMTASGGSGYLYETVTTIASKMGNSKDTASFWLTNSGEGRSEMRIPVPGAHTGKIIAIGHSAQPGYSMILDNAERTYTLNIIDTALINSGSQYEVTRIGTETVSGYPCTHVRVSNNIGSGAFKSSTTFDLWTSTAVPGYSLYSKLLTLSGSQGGMIGSLNKAGAAGFLVKMTGGGDGAGYSMVMQLQRVQQRNFPASLFKIPAGYSNSGMSMAQRLLTGSVPANNH
ncbi:MAG TPA: DUF4412 domain-containing protein [Puia sp.]|nr:DUF4412 domain-containing protein [Puia sp.]